MRVKKVRETENQDETSRIVQYKTVPVSFFIYWARPRVVYTQNANVGAHLLCFAHIPRLQASTTTYGQFARIRMVLTPGIRMTIII